MKILVGQFLQESNSFSATKSTLDSFKQEFYKYGNELYKSTEKTETELAGAFALLRERKAEVICSIAMQACSGGPVTKEAYSHFLEVLLGDIRENSPIDGVYLCMHGATILEDQDDGVGYILSIVREEIGMDIPISVSLDLHANVTDTMVSNATIIRGYQTYPHTDLYQTGYDAAGLLVDIVEKTIEPQMVSVRIPMIVQSEKTQTTSGAMCELAQMARKAEQHEDIISVSYFQVQPWMDVSDIGCTIVVIGQKNTSYAEEVAVSLADYFWSIKEKFSVELATFEDVIKLVDQTDELVIISDAADAPSSGAVGDSNIFIKKYIEMELEHIAFMAVVDPVSVEKAIEAGVGNVGVFNVGGGINRDFYTPVEVKGTVVTLSNGDYTVYGDYDKGKSQNMGKTAVISYKNLKILAMEHPVALNDPGPYFSVGLDPSLAKLVLVKSPNQFKSIFKKYSRHMVVVASQGASNSYFWELPFKNLPNPIYPFQKFSYKAE